MGAKKGETKKCLYCGKKFKSANKNQLYCSYDCRLKAMYKRNREKYVPKGKEHEAICVVCGKSFISKAAGKYCSDECRKKASKERFSASYVPRERKGHEAICAVCGKSFIAHSSGKYCSDECRKKAKLDQQKAYRKRFRKDFYEDDDLSTDEILLSTQEKTASTNEKLLSTGRDLWSIAKAAFEHGMTYGKYVEALESGKIKL